MELSLEQILVFVEAHPDTVFNLWNDTKNPAAQCATSLTNVAHRTTDWDKFEPDTPYATLPLWYQEYAAKSGRYVFELRYKTGAVIAAAIRQHLQEREHD